MSLKDARTAVINAYLEIDFEDSDFDQSTDALNENTVFEPNGRRVFHTIDFTPVSAPVFTLAGGGLNLASGYIQINIYELNGKGDAKAINHFEKIFNRFNQSRNDIKYNDTCVRTQDCVKNGGIQSFEYNGAYFATPIRIDFTAFIKRS